MLLNIRLEVKLYSLCFKTGFRFTQTYIQQFVLRLYFPQDMGVQRREKILQPCCADALRRQPGSFTQASNNIG